MAYLAPALVQLRNEINAAHPKRDKSSDGWIGDASHAARKSDHNPDPPVTGVVRATDTDKDGMDKAELRRVATNDPHDRAEYFIQDGLIYSRRTGFRPQKYTGSNGHYGHGHVSLRHGRQFENDTRPWGYNGGGSATPLPVQAPSGGGKSIAEVAAEVRRGAWGNGDDRKRRLEAAGYNYEQVRAVVNGGSAPNPAPAPSKLGINEIVAEVKAGKWGNGADRKRRLEAAGYNYEQVRAVINGGGAPAAAPARKSVDQLAAEVMAGQWGNNPERSRRLQAAGYSPSEVQKAVNARSGGGGGRAVRLSVSVLADQVIAGQWGNGTERQRRITAAGYDYQAVRAEVNRRV